MKRPLLKLKKSLLPGARGSSGQASSVLPSQIKRPPDTKRSGTNLDPPRPHLPPPQREGVPQSRRMSACITAAAPRTLGLVQPGKKISRKTSDPGPLKSNHTFAKPVHPIATKEATNPSMPPPSKPTIGTTPARDKTGIVSKSNPSTPTRPTRGGVKQPPYNNNIRPKRPTLAAATVSQETTRASSAKVTSVGLSMSIVSSGSPSVQQSTPLGRRGPHSNVASDARARGTTVVKAINTTVTKVSSSIGAQCKEEEEEEKNHDDSSSLHEAWSDQHQTGECAQNSGRHLGIYNMHVISLYIHHTIICHVCDTFFHSYMYSLSSIDSECDSAHQNRPTQCTVESTPRTTSKMKRRSFIPTPIRQVQ